MQFCHEISLIIWWILLPTEEDPHGADGRGNPLGSLIFSNGFPSNNGNNGTFQQVIEWHKYVLYQLFHVLLIGFGSFLGGNIFCIKVCDPAGAHAADFCQHKFGTTE